MEKLLVATYDQDLQQFEMFCHCLVRNWKGNPRLDVVLGKGTNADLVKSIVNKIFPIAWIVKIKECVVDSDDGYLQQQINKVFYSIDDEFDDVIVFDSKDFVLRSMDMTTFKHNDRYRATFYIPSQRLVDLCPAVSSITDRDVSQIPSTINLTPWIWNVKQLEKCWRYLNDRFGDYHSWVEYPGGGEVYSFFSYTWLDAYSIMKWHTPDSNPLLVGGGWTHQSYEGMLQESQDFDQWTERKIWKHSRKLEDPRCVDVTKSVLLKYGIEQEIIDQVFGL
jgi:hypothetical protein